MSTEALSRCITSAIERIEGGTPPPAKLAAEVKQLAKDAGLGFPEAAQPLVARALLAPAIRQAPQAFWSGFRAPITQWAKQSREARDALFSLLPDIPTTRWLPILEVTGVADEMRAGEHETADWIRRFIHKESDRWRQHFPAELSTFIRTLPSQQGKTLELNVPLADVELELVDAALSLGLEVTFTEPGDPECFSWRFWLEDERRGDLAHLAASEHATRAAVGLNRIALGPHLDTLRAHPGSAQLLHRWAAPRVGHGCTAAEFWAEVDRLRPLCLPAHRDEFRDELAGLASVADPAELTAQALRDGLLTELTWPALEEAARQLDDADPGRLTFHESWPWFGVASGNRIIWVTADTTEALVTVTPPERSHHDHWQWFRIGGDTLCLSWTPDEDPHMTWASSPRTHHTLTHILGGNPGFISFETPSGRLLGPGLIRPGDSRLKLRLREPVLQEDGDHWCAQYLHPIRAVDPRTGRLGPESLPPRLASLVEDDLRQGFTLRALSVQHWMSVVSGTEDSPLGVLNGQHGWVCLRRGPLLRCRSIDGTVWEREDAVWQHRFFPAARLRRPGGGHWIATGTGHLTRESGEPLAPASDLTGRDHLLHRLPVAGWHFLTPRDEQVSARLRQLLAEDVADLLEALADWSPEEPETLPEPVIAAAQRLLGTTEAALTVAVGWLALRISRAVQQFTTATSSHDDLNIEREPTR
ncbi:MAG: hypothetical protein Q4D96_11655 [Propionibacteriaceae bacterium]|nr:hypothetical protein [Propionibacteriaceae bacterium]